MHLFHFLHFLKTIPSVFNPISAGNEPFIKLANHMQNGNFDKAINELLFLLRTDADLSLCIQYLIKLLPLMEKLEPLFNALPSFFRRLSDADQMEIALHLSHWYEKRQGYVEAITCTVKAFKNDNTEAFLKEPLSFLVR